VSALALGLVLVAAFSHASWNYLLKKSGGGPGVVALSCAVSLAVWAPLAIGTIVFTKYQFHPMHLVLMLGSGLIHTAYFLLLDRAYRAGGDLSIVYPLARATGPMITIVVAILLLGERPSAVAMGGAVLIGASALLLTGNPFSWHKGEARHAVGFALLTGCMIAGYTVWDKASVATWLVPPLLYDWGCNGFRCVVLVPFLHRRMPGAMTAAWRDKRVAIFAVAILSPLSYILVLTAMVFTPVSLVAPAREISSLFAALLGAHLLREGDALRRSLAAMGMVLGMSGLALG
jgi:drug/metabolite transporter (DMT)-like permease